MNKYDYLVVGSGLFGSVFAHEAKYHGKKVLVIDKRQHIAGNVYTEKIENINVHIYGAHIFHTNLKHVWDYVNQFAAFNRFTNSPVASYHGELYSLPFNMYTFNKMWGVITPEEAAAKIEEQKREAGIKEPKNLEEQAISLVGTDIYEKLIKGYTEKQWGRPCTELPAFIIKRLPVRFTFDNNYFNALYQGIPVGGYTQMVANMLEGIEVQLGVDYLGNRGELDALADKVVYTGAIDASPITGSLYPYMIKTKDLNIIKKILFMVMPVILIGTIVMYYLAPWGLTIIGGKKYVSAVPLLRAFIPLLILSFPAMLFGWPCLGAINKQAETSLTTVISSAVQVVCLCILLFINQFTLLNLAFLRGLSECLMLIMRLAFCFKYRYIFV